MTPPVVLLPMQRLAALVLVVGLSPLSGAAESVPPAQALATILAGNPDQRIAGSEGWIFLRSELASYARPPFWGDAARSLYPEAKQPDPLAVIADASAQVAAAGAQLLVVPVPGKCVVYPDRLAPPLGGAPDAVHRAALAELTRRGVAVVDLTAAFAALRAGGSDPFLKGDSHWSPAGLAKAAELVAERCQGAAWNQGVVPGAFTTASETVSGDLGGVDTIPVIRPTLDGQAPLNDPTSPVVVLGDSHGLVFSTSINRGIQLSGCGFPEHLAARLGRRVDNVSRQGDGVNQTREELRDRGDHLAKKKLLVWVFRSSLLTEYDDARGWKLTRLVARAP